MSISLDLFYEPKVVVDTTFQTHEEWLLQRLIGIGGSELGIILNASPWSSKLELWNRKVNRIVDDKDPKNWYQLEYGHVTEEINMKKFREKTGFEVWRDTNMYQHPFFPFMIADVDFRGKDLLGNEFIGEIKTTNPSKVSEFHEGIIGEEGKLPYTYEMQIRHYMAVLNIPKAYCCIYFDNSGEPIIVEVRRDLGIEEMIIEAEGEFWKSVEEKVRPEEFSISDAKIKSYRAAKGMYDLPTEEKGESIKLLGKVKTDDKLADDCERYIGLRDQIAELEDQINALKEQQNAISPVFTEELADCDKGVVFVTDSDNGYEIQFKKSVRTTIDSKKLKISYPEIYHQLKNETVVRPFKIVRKTKKVLEKVAGKDFAV